MSGAQGTGPATLAVLLAPRLGAGVEEFLRICVAFVAGGGSLTLVEAGPGRGVLSAGRDLPDEVERGLEGLAAFGTVARAVEGDELAGLLRGCEHVLRVAAPVRAGTPDLLVLDDAYLTGVASDALLRALAAAGQVIRA